MFSRLFYITIGFVVGYFLDSLRGGKEGDEIEDVEGEQNGLSKPVKQPMTQQTTEPEAPELTVPVSVKEDTPDRLQLINGIGPVYAKRLFESGIQSFSALASADKITLIEITKVRNLAQVDQWIVEAQDLFNK